MAATPLYADGRGLTVTNRCFSLRIMPTVLRIRGFRFYFYANEGSEPPHIHVDKGGATAKLWLSPFRWEYANGFSPAQQRIIKEIIREHHDELLIRWNERFGKQNKICGRQ